MNKKYDSINDNDGFDELEEYSKDEDNSNLDDSLYNDGDDRKPKLVIIIVGIVILILLILLFSYACSKMNKKNNNNHLTSIRVANGILSPEFNNDTTNYQIITTEDVVTVTCTAESSKAVATGCGKRIYLIDECVDHEIKVVAEDKSERKYNLKVCKQEENAPVVKSVELSPEGFTRGDVIVTVIAESNIPLHRDAYSIDGGLSWQGTNKFVISENKTIEVKVRNSDNIESAIVTKEINNIDKTSISVEVRGSTDSGVSTQSNVELTAIPDPSNSSSGYRYQWYNGKTKINGATGSTYIAKSSGNYKVVLSTESGNSVTSKEYKVVINKSSSSGGGNSGGNGGSSNTYRLEVSVIGNPTSWTNKDVTLSVNASTSNGLAEKPYSFDGGKTYQKANTKAFSSNQTVSVVVKDKKNNTASYKVYITKIDKTTPNVSISGTYYVGNKLTANVTPQGSASGYKYQWYRDNTAISGATSLSYTPSTTGKYHIVVKTGAGTSKLSSVVTISSPITPSVTLTGSVTSGTVTNNNVVLTATTNNGTATKYEWYKNNAIYNGCTSSKCTIADNGEATYKARAVTSSGITSFSNTYTVKIDKAGPSVTITAKVGSSSGSTYKSGTTATDKVYIRVDATDASSNLSDFEYQYLSSDQTNNTWYSATPGAWDKKVISGKTGYAELYLKDNNTYPFKVRVKDKFGNTTTKSLEVKINIGVLAAPTINLSSTEQTTSNVTFTLTKPSNLVSGAKLQYSYDKKTWTDYSSKVTLLNNTGVKTVYARSVDSSGKASSVVSATGKCNKDAVTVDRNSNGTDSGNKCYITLKLTTSNSGLVGITSNKYEYVYWSPKKTTDTTNVGKVSVCGSVPTTGIKTTTNGITAKLYLKYSNQYYCFAVRPYRATEISGLNRWTVQRKLANTSASCSSSAYNGNS